MSSEYVSEQENINDKTEELLIRNGGDGPKVGNKNNASDLSQLP